MSSRLQQARTGLPRIVWMCVILLLLVISTVNSAEDYYELLGVSRDADAREIRKAFKKKALSMHPDKNKDDPKAHDKFTTINRAYEVLKDEELRKKYDMFGEEGLKDNKFGGHYESWNFYQQNFGIYDDDPEIVTLSKADFDQAVDSAGDVWFINYYSPHCSHCHDLAPTWRDVAKELEGVIRVGAVNCGDEIMLCRQQGIRSYPSLILYPSRERYYGGRDASDFVDYALRQVKAVVTVLRTGNFKGELTDSEKVDFPWLITFCGDGGDCLSKKTLTKLAAMLSGLVNVGSIDCFSQTKLCNKLGVEYGTYFYQPGEVEKDKGLEITSLEYKETAFRILEQLPDVTIVDKEKFEDIVENLKKNSDTAWLIHFVEGDTHDLELRKLPALLGEMNVGRVDCRKQRSKCNEFHIHKPTFAVFKRGGGYEFHHGRLSAHDVAAFAKDSASTPVRMLGPTDFPSPVISSREPWIVDFFAPWCPPCMKLLPEFRKASKTMRSINFGTVDCTIHSQLCHTYNIRSYPTTIFYNQSTPFQFHGHHNAHSIKEFLQDTIQPPVIHLTPASFEEHVSNKSPDEIWLVDFFAPWCGPCQQLAPEWRRLAKMLKKNAKVKVAHVDCQQHKTVCQQQNVYSYPTIRLYPMGTRNAASFHIYNGWFRDAESLRAWAFEFLPSKVAILRWDVFQEILGGSQPWIVDFYAPWCGHCQVFAPEFERVAEALEGRVRAGKVNCDEQQWLCQQAGIGAYPTVRFYAGAHTPGFMQDMFGEELFQDANHIISHLKQRVPKITHNQENSQGHDEL
ncbi:dnaJ homolog subfamily C member 10 [Lingula anatina]|uniref:DnaJ homolog subfamily C member 10 n=1 Tax=Lingula anatina TaxID=7574 RepID=A0A1S3ICH4_LINAN|nr:dnaJ homolog subfamily C member 10 [Lingula anatina]|eukprot:XP_013395942.1 dnaJ homolog subfamily C member 10 [Lingula anatina]